ncbi:hypothetical protein KO527_25190 [Pseudoalteromonas sp. C2R02]|uniref:hypothetical protein n=1 Tax=Pseudoalteromonas sp. C2R02 TaxID=2841565 RepID=UPI001C08D65A|nr:hypothetical protein [Pseudoalteromonas sp. C2R02]MBU2972636.1 hypothetical protein [Pseudoalteromonas sp. C2R02]
MINHIKYQLKKIQLVKKVLKWRHNEFYLNQTQHQLNLAIDVINKQNLADIKNKKALIQKAACNKIKRSELIVSLTTYGERINIVHITILSLLNQSIAADKVILWLAEDEFKLSELPNKLTQLCDFGLEIKFYKDIRSFKKLIPTLTEFQNNTIITFDDDVIYPSDQIEKLITAHETYPKAIICHHARNVALNSDNQPEAYNEWLFCTDETKPSEPNKNLFPVGIGGVLYPKNALHNDVMDEKTFTELCPKADDLWFKVMALKNNTLTMLVDNPRPYRDYLLIPQTQDGALWQQNKFSNDAQLKNLLNAYPDIKFN